MATIIAIITILVGATGAFVQMQKSLNIIWEVKTTTTKSGIWSVLRTRLFSFGLILSIAFLLLVSLVLSALLSALGSWVLKYWTESFLVLFQIFDVVFSVVFITSLFAVMFKMLPDAKIKWNAVWVGAFFTALLFVIGKSGLGYYFGKVNPGSGYGQAGSVVLILLWVSYSSLILFFGAEFTKVYSDHYNSAASPSDNAVIEKGRIK